MVTKITVNCERRGFQNVFILKGTTESNGKNTYLPYKAGLNLQF